MSLVVTGTGTEVGKTVASAVLALRYGTGGSLAYWKPVASGSLEGETDSQAVRRLTAGQVEVLAETYCFEEPLSPHLAARLEARRVEPEGILKDFATHRRRPGDLLVEGVGGLLVPLTDEGFLVADLLVEMGLPCLVVALSGLGTLNHTFLTLEALRRRGLEVAGVVMNGPPNDENRRAVESLGGADVLELPRLAELTPESLVSAAAGFDPEERLRRFLPGRTSR
jgi:dethiobiotin synthase